MPKIEFGFTDKDIGHEWNPIITEVERIGENLKFIIAYPDKTKATKYIDLEMSKYAISKLKEILAIEQEKEVIEPIVFKHIELENHHLIIRSKFLEKYYEQNPDYYKELVAFIKPYSTRGISSINLDNIHNSIDLDKAYSIYIFNDIVMAQRTQDI